MQYEEMKSRVEAISRLIDEKHAIESFAQNRTSLEIDGYQSGYGHHILPTSVTATAGPILDALAKARISEIDKEIERIETEGLAH